MKNSFYVIEERHTKTGKTYAHAETINNAYNLVYKFKPRPNFEIVSINAADTKKQAEEIADFWNEGAKTRGKYYFK
jgi:hypothetical protein